MIRMGDYMPVRYRVVKIMGATTASQINHPFRRLMLVLFSKRFEVMPPHSLDLSVM